ncbi:hypothetical protein GDO86_008637 [Hymenochirus boettgeri]|uniref:Uncharacterized protein n=1 Tax=Hymenochirus boettgeri TaxID=247094 RepID=A0A8T2J2X4_9PIPI|nr:hypothetical protein GDO86_008637 [Hymenochirus boettgeri]
MELITFHANPVLELLFRHISLKAPQPLVAINLCTSPVITNLGAQYVPGQILKFIFSLQIPLNDESRMFLIVLDKYVIGSSTSKAN